MRWIPSQTEEARREEKSYTCEGNRKDRGRDKDSTMSVTNSCVSHGQRMRRARLFLYKADMGDSVLPGAIETGVDATPG